ncbi:muscarinic acetylcholine receptor gar-2-like isoform X2 [Macrobrachium nipponense]|uniref:muscarinic acetylcholine receptor gar-2-like isoform X2 n=1 Tax=Macrobrachium nipponense TaxID=159736 RepID=UPI0030C83681
MDGDILQDMGMQEAKTKLYNFCRDLNSTSQYHIHGTNDGRMSMSLMIVMLVLGFVTFFVNLGVIIRTIKILRHGHDNKPAFYFIGNLALSDLAIGLYIVIAFLLHLTNKSDLWQRKSCTLQIAVAVTVCQETIFTIMLIAVDKYLYICHALKYHQIVTMTRVYVAVLLSWVASVIIGSLPAMGMLVDWEETCGRCIFAQVVSKNFAIVFFVTAVVFPYAVAVSLYSILLYLAIKMQKARYGGSYKINETSKSSYFRLSLMSKKSTKSRTSSASSVKSTSSKSTVLTSDTNASAVSAAKAQRRRIRRQAMQEYKATLPGLSEMDNRASSKLVSVRSVIVNEGILSQTQNELAETDGKMISHLKRNRHSSEVGQLPSLENFQRNEENGGHAERNLPTENLQCRTETVEEEKEEEEHSKCNANLEYAEKTVKQYREDNSISSENVTAPDISQENRHCNFPFAGKDQPMSGGSSTEHGNIKSTFKTASKQLSDSSKSSKSLASLPSSDLEDEEDSQGAESPRWSLFAYFNRVVSDTKDKVLFFKKCQAVKTVFLIIGSFTVTYVPFVVGTLIYSLENEKSKALLHALQTILFIAIVANSIANPLLYAYGYSEFRIRTEKFKGVFARKQKPKL